METKVRWDVRRAPNFFLPLGIFDSYVCLIQNKIFFGTLRRISDLTNLAVTSRAFSCLLNPGLYGTRGQKSRLRTPARPFEYPRRMTDRGMYAKISAYRDGLMPRGLQYIVATLAKPN